MDPREPPWDQLDPLIRPYVRALYEAGFDTYESCQGGEGHSAAAPFIRFKGNHHVGFKALALAIDREWPVIELARFWHIMPEGPVGPDWQMRFGVFEGGR